MLAAISSARKTVNFEAYIFWSDEAGRRFRDALAERAAHGVAVRVLLDAVGSPGRRMKAEDVDVLRKAGCRVEFFHSTSRGCSGSSTTARTGASSSWTARSASREASASPIRGGERRFEGALARHAGAREGPAVRGLQRAFQENWSEVTGRSARRRGVLPRAPQPGASAVAVVPSSPLAAMSGAGRVYAIRSPPPRARSGSRTRTSSRTRPRRPSSSRP